MDVLSEFGSSLDGLAESQARTLPRAQALDLVSQALTCHEQVLVQAPKNVGYQVVLTAHYRTLARIHQTWLQPAEAGVAFRRAKTIQPDNAQVLYQVARGFAQCAILVGRKDAESTAMGEAERLKYLGESLDTLSQAVEKGFTEVQALEKSTEFEPLRSDVRFKKLLLDLHGNQTTRICQRRLVSCAVSPGGL